MNWFLSPLPYSAYRWWLVWLFKCTSFTDFTQTWWSMSLCHDSWSPPASRQSLSSPICVEFTDFVLTRSKNHDLVISLQKLCCSNVLLWILNYNSPNLIFYCIFLNGNVPGIKFYFYLIEFLIWIFNLIQ